MKYSSIDLLSELNLDDYFLYNQFQLLPKESSVKWKKYYNPQNGCKYLVGKPKTQWIYKNTQDDTTFKNVFDFEREHNPEIMSFTGSENEKSYLIIKKLNDFLEPSIQSSLQTNEIVQKAKKTIEKKKKLSETTQFNKTPIYDFDYLII